jgi:hypothetical protein
LFAATAELYGMAMAHLYQDPNLNNLNHWAIIQVSHGFTFFSSTGGAESPVRRSPSYNTVSVLDTSLDFQAH